MNFKKRIKKALEQDGFENFQSAIDVADLNRPRSRPSNLEGDGRVASVLLLFYQPEHRTESNTDASLVLTVRQAGLSNHGGQISFPGGRRENDESLWNTAVRETYEEVGVKADKVENLGRLNSVYIPPSDFTVNPFIGWHDGSPSFVRCEQEVAEIIETPLTQLLDPNTLQFRDIVSGSGRKLTVPCYCIGEANEYPVWGATALILSELIERFRVLSQS